MRDILTHRGPDDRGLFLDDEVGLGHRRLSIVDIRGGHQPMLNADGTLCIVYNGEVYNHPALRAVLEACGARYRTTCDTESVLRAFEKYRDDAPRHLRGMFAFAVWDRRQRELFLARDRFGVKPLYYTLTPNGSLYFASEIKALLVGRAVKPELNVAALPDYLANHAPSGSETLFRDVRRLPPGCTLRWRNGDVHVERYWEMPSPGAEVAPARLEEDLVAEFDDLFRAAVRIRLMADVPLGVFLSGGIDSAAIAAVMSELVDEPVRTFSVAFNERGANELAYARVVAERFRTEHHEVIVTPRQFFGALPQLLWHEDEPLAHPSSVALNFVSRLAARHVKVVLTGEGSDELLAGYGRYRTTVYNLALGRTYERMTPSVVRSAIRGLVGRLPPGGSIGRKLTRTALYLPTDLTSLYFDNFAVFGRVAQRKMLHPEMRERVSGIDPYTVHRELLDAIPDASLLPALLHVDSKTYLHELLMKQDQMSMAASIESRVPFLDHGLAEFVAALPDRLKLRGLRTKYVLRRAMRTRLPPLILQRRKMGFPVPVGSWFRDHFQWVLDDYVLGERALARRIFDPSAVRSLVARHLRGEDHSERLWSLVNLELWHRLFIDGEAADQIAWQGRAATHVACAGALHPSLTRN